MSLTPPLPVVLAGISVRRSVLLPVGGVGVLVSAPLVACLFLTDEHTTIRLCAALLVLAVSALAQLGATLAIERRTEAGVAAMRGLRGLRLAVLLVAEPLLVLVVGSAVGGLLGGLLARRLAPGPGVAGPPWSASVATLLAVVLVILVVAVLAGTLAAARRPLIEQISPVVRRRRGGSPWLTLLALVVLAVTVLAGYRAANGAGADGDWVVVAGPVALGLSGGLVALVTVRIMAAALRRATRDAALSPWLTSRFLAFGAGRSLLTGLAVAGLVVAGLAALQAQASSRWLDDTARVHNGAALRVPFEEGAINALQLTRKVDPEGRWLMAGQVLSDGSDASRRVVQLDTTRYDRVVAPLLASTPAARTAARLDALREAPKVRLVTGRSLTVAGSMSGSDPGGRSRTLGLRIDFVDDSGTLSSGELSLPVAADGSFAGTAHVLGSCRGGCAVTGLELDARAAKSAVVRLDRLDAGDVGQLGLPWSLRPDVLGGTSLLSSGPGELTVRFRGSAELAVGDPLAAIPVLATPDVSFAAGQGVSTVGGTTRSPHVVGTAAALPVVQASGVLEDLSVAALGAAPSPPVAHVFILARADTPEQVLAQLPRGTARTLDDARDAAARAAGTRLSWLYAGAGLAGLLVIALVVLAHAGRRRVSRRRERDALRLAAVPAHSSARAQRLATGLTVMVASLVAIGFVVAAQQLFFDSLDLVDLPAAALDFGPGVPW